VAGLSIFQHQTQSDTFVRLASSSLKTRRDSVDFALYFRFPLHGISYLRQIRYDTVRNGLIHCVALRIYGTLQFLTLRYVIREDGKQA